MADILINEFLKYGYDPLTD